MITPLVIQKSFRHNQNQNTEEKQMENEKNINTFADMENQSAPISEEVVKAEQPKVEQTEQSEISVGDFSDKAIGDKVKYIRPDLNGKTDVIEKFQVFYPDTTKEPNTTQAGDKEYWVPTMVLNWKSLNAEGLQNREYISGARVWKNKEMPSKDIQFWYEGGADNENQSCILWEKVADCLGLKYDEMSPRQFVVFLNSQPKFKIEAMKVKNYKPKPGAPRFVYKNMPGEFLKE